MATTLTAKTPSAISTQPATRPTESNARELISRLSDADPQMRESATKALWSMGRSAEPALRQASQSDDPEVARRARAILRDFTYGLYPDAPAEIFSMLDQYRRGDVPHKRLAAMKLCNSGVPGLRVLLRLSDDERDANLKQMIWQMLSTREHDVAVLLLAEGRTPQAQSMLESSAVTSASAAQDYAALLLMEGKLPAVYQARKTAAATATNAALLVALARASGDLATARDAAEKAPGRELLDAVLVEQGDWKRLQQRLQADAEGLEPPERLGYLCAYQRLAGEEEAARQTAAQLVAHADQTPQDSLYCAENLFLSDQPEEGVLVLLKHDDAALACQYLAPRLRFNDVLQLARKYADQHTPQALQVESRAVGALYFTGHTDEAKKLLDQVARDNEQQNDPETWIELINNARQLGLSDKADQYTLAAVQRPDRRDPLPLFFERIGYADGAEAAAWWTFLRQAAGDNRQEALKHLHSIYNASLEPEDLDALLKRAEKFASGLSPAAAQAWRLVVAQTLAHRLGRADLAASWFAPLAAQSSTPTILIHCGDFDAEQGHWQAAADHYQAAFERDPTQASALFLQGWALSHGPDADEGKRLMERADMLPLGSESGRYALLQTMIDRKLSEPAAREISLILSVTPPRSFERNEALRRAAEQTAARGDYLTAAGLFDRAFLQNLSNNISFREPWANEVVPALIHKLRALGLVKGGRIDDALKHAHAAMNDAPGDADALIEIVNALDGSGHRAQADDLYDQWTAIYRKLAADYPDSGPAHNQLAWAQVKCRRELDDALTNARRAVELEPNSTASLDTLAEVYFTRGQLPQAIEQIQKCIQLEPRVGRHRQQLARFQAALHPATRPG